MAIFENFPYTNLHELNLDWIIEQVKKWSDEVKELDIKFDNLDQAFESLKTYVDDYFDNLDIQEEVDNKLDEMMEAGQLQEIIAEFLQSEGVVTFDTTAEMVAATNLIDGSVALRLGDVNYHDGHTSIYRIREITNTDVVDGVNIIALSNYPELIAELIVNINDQPEPQPEPDQLIFITDSYGNYVNNDNKNFIQVACEYAGITDYLDFHRGSAGFSRTGDLNFLKVFQDNESYIEDADMVKEIYVLGGANDQNADYVNIETGILNFTDYIKANYTNAKVYIGFVTKSFEIDYYPFASRTLAAYQACTKYGAAYLLNSEAIMQQFSAFRSDRVHPTTEYVDKIAQYVANLIILKGCDVKQKISQSVKLNPNHSLVVNNGCTLSPNKIMEMLQNNNTVNLTAPGAFVLFTLNFATAITVNFEYYINGLLELDDTFFISDGNNSKGLTGICTIKSGSRQVPVLFTAWIPIQYTDSKPVINMFLYPSETLTNVTSIIFQGTGTVNCF